MSIPLCNCGKCDYCHEIKLVQDQQRMDDDGGHMHHPHRHRNAKRRFYRRARDYVAARETGEASGELYQRMRIAYYALLDTES